MVEKTSSKILLVEDELIIAEHISRELQKYGYEIIDILMKGEHVPGFIAKNRPDLIIMDINLAGQLDGIETAKIISETEKIPVVFLTGNVDDKTFERSKIALPFAFIGKPFKTQELVRGIELALERVEKVYSIDDSTKDKKLPPTSADANYIFIRDKEKMTKVLFEDILYLQADRSYSQIYSKQKTYVISSPLIKLEEKLDSPIFQRIHRSFVVNVNAVDEFDDNYIFINGQSVPISKSYKQDLLQKFKTI